jgi:hypothetical protein
MLWVALVKGTSFWGDSSNSASDEQFLLWVRMAEGD